jgi:hypothetical protein
MAKSRRKARPHSGEIPETPDGQRWGDFPDFTEEDERIAEEVLLQLGKEKEAVISQLREYLRLIDEITGMYGTGTGIAPDKKPMAQAKMKALKEKLRSDDQRVSSLDKANGLNATEDAFLRPAVNRSFNHIRVRWNSNPSGWHDDLAEARIDIDHYLGAMEHRTP